MEPSVEAEISKLKEPEDVLNVDESSDIDAEKLEGKSSNEISDTGIEIAGATEAAEVSTDLEKEGLEEKKQEEETTKLRDDDKQEPPTTREEIECFLRERSLSQSFVTTFLKIGFTDEVHRFLCALGFTYEDTKDLRSLWHLEVKNRDEIDSFASVPSSSNEYLSKDGMYLRCTLSKPLSHALREIVAKKPFDPVEYLGHWLLNYKICEEKRKIRKEFELELMIERERFKQSTMIEETPASIGEEEGEEEEFLDDWSFLNDE